jgi:hypothetical protein
MLSKAHIIDGPNRVRVSMFKKTTIILAIILVILIIGAGIYYYIENYTRSSMPFAGIQNNVDSIEVRQMDTTSLLQKQEDTWFVASSNNNLANQMYINDIMQALESLQVVEIASTNPNNQADLQVDGTSTEVKLFAGDKLFANFFVGRSGPGTTATSYMRFEGEDKVYLVKALLPRLFGYPEWRDMIVSQIGSEVITEIKWDNGLYITKDETGWNIIEPQVMAIEEIAIDGFLTAIGDLKAMDIADINISDLDPQGVNFSVEVKTIDNVEWRFAFWQHDLESGDYDYYVVREANDVVYIVSKYTAENVLMEFSQF